MTRSRKPARRAVGQRRMDPYHRPSPTPDWEASEPPVVISDPWLIDQLLSEGSPVADAMSEYDRAILVRMREAATAREASATTTEESTTMTETTTAPRSLVTQAELDALQGAFLAALTKVNERVDTIQEGLDALRASLPSTAPSTADRCQRFLESHAGVKFNPTSVAENIDIDANTVAGVLKRLAGGGHISVKAEPNRNPLYFVRD